MRVLGVAKGISVVLIVILLLLSIFITYEYIQLYNQFIELKVKLLNIENELEITKSQLEYYMRISRYYQGINASGYSPSTISEIIFKAVAIKSTEKGYVGEVLNISISLVPGSGRIFVATQPRVGIDLQASLNIARDVAERVTNVSLNRYDIIVVVSASEEVDVVDGPSAGGLITAALIIMIEGKSLNISVFATGTINPDGSIGKVGGVLEKAVAAAKAGCKLFLVPKGQKYDYIIEWEEVFPGFFVGVRKLVDVEKYVRDLGFNMKVIEVYNIYDLLKYLTC